MSINLFTIIVLFCIECLSLINRVNCSSDNNNITTTTTMLILTTAQSSSINDNFKRRSARHFINKALHFTDNNNITSSTYRIRIFGTTNHYNTVRNFFIFTKTQIKVTVIVVVIISLVMLIIAIFCFKNACRSQENDNLQTDIFRDRSSQCNEPSSRRGSVGYYTRKYSRTTSFRSNNQIDNSSPSNRLDIPACDQLPKSAAVVAVTSSPVDTTDGTHRHQHHVISSCDTSNTSNQHISIVPISSINLNTTKHKSAVPINRTSQITLTQLIRSNIVRYIFVINVHDQRLRYPTKKRNNIKLSSPTLRKLCLPCITTRHRLRHHHSNKKKTRKPNQHRFAAGVTREDSRVESLQQFEVFPRTCCPKTTIPIVHNSDYATENNANHFHEQRKHFEISLQNEKLEEENNNETSPVKIESKLTSSDVVESDLLLSSISATELTRLKDNDACDDRTPLLTSELSSTIKGSLKPSSRKYSFNALLPLIHPSNSHPLCSYLTSTTNANGTQSSNGNDIDLKARHRTSISSALRRSSFAKQPRAFCSTIDSPRANSLSKTQNNSDSSDQISLLNNSSSENQNNSRKSSSITPPYQKEYMQRIERFRFIDDSASSTATVTSPVESLEHVNTRPTSCSHLITNTIEQFDDYVRTRYNNMDGNDDDDDSLIDRLNSNLLNDSSYSDLNILNNNNHNPSPKPILRPQTFKPVNNKPFAATILSGSQQHKYHQSTPISIPHSMTSLPLSKQRNQMETNGYSRSMDFQSLTNKRDPIRPLSMISTVHETPSSSSSTTLTSLRSATSLEFDDNTKPSGVLVDDDFLPMSSPVDEHFWDMNIKSFNELNANNNKCFPDVGSSPDMEIKHFALKSFHTLSETSCDEDDDSTTSIDQPETFTIQECKLDELKQSIVLTTKTSPAEGNVDQSSSTPSIDSTEQRSNNTTLTTSHQSNDESLLEKFSLPAQTSIGLDFVCDSILSSNQHSQATSEDDDTQDSSIHDASEGDDSADNGEIDLVQEFELSQRDTQTKTNNLWTTNDPDVYIIQDGDLLSALVTTPTTTMSRTPPASIMKITNNKSFETIDEQQTLKPKVRFNLDPQYEREREWNKVNKLLGNSVEWTDEFEV
ncbi:unnamed protein product [Rotaria socialis]|uniref:Uncharacterized protein n=1 Tax=Rotaria socialis TaxID=392032 RepID=A0A820WXR7_9BILA|nr:unnamed protein product [Rotaria socialis]